MIPISPRSCILIPLPLSFSGKILAIKLSGKFSGGVDGGVTGFEGVEDESAFGCPFNWGLNGEICVTHMETSFPSRRS